MKKIFYILFPFCLVFVLSLSGSAASFSAYGSVTNSTSYVNTLVGYYLNSSEEGKWSNDFIVIRTGQYQYDLFFADDFAGADQVKYYRLTGVTSGYNTEWVFSSGTVSNFSYSLGNYTAVGNVAGTVKSSDYSTQRFIFMAEIFLIVLIIVCFLRFLRFGGSKVELH